MKQLAQLLVALIVGIAPMGAGALNTWGTDITDLWWNPTESGWGVNVSHQQEVLFITLFVYGADGRVKWYVGPAVTSLGGADKYTFRGDFYETTGPFLGATFNPAAVTARVVGTVTLELLDVRHATLSYTVDGVPVSKAIERQTFRRADTSGAYYGGAVGTISGCALAGTYEGEVFFAISQEGADFLMSSQAGARFCVYRGEYTQSGRFGRVPGTFTCTGGGPNATGTFTAFEIEAGYNGFIARFNASHSGCTETGRIGGLKR